MMPFFLPLSWGFPLLVVALVGSFQAEGFSENTAGGWCWIRDDPPHGKEWVWLLVGAKLYEWPSVFLITPAFYFLVWLRLNGIRKQMDRNSLGGSGHRRHPSQLKASAKKMRFFELRLQLVPVIFVFTRVWGGLRTMLTIANGQNYLFLGVMQAMFDPSQGFFNGLLFVVCFSSRPSSDSSHSMQDKPGLAPVQKLPQSTGSAVHGSLQTSLLENDRCESGAQNKHHLDADTLVHTEETESLVQPEAQSEGSGRSRQKHISSSVLFAGTGAGTLSPSDATGMHAGCSRHLLVGGWSSEQRDERSERSHTARSEFTTTFTRGDQSECTQGGDSGV
jgi:hypothetical protein